MIIIMGAGSITLAKKDVLEVLKGNK